MTQEEKRAYLETAYRKSPEGSARRIWAAAQLAQLNGPRNDDTGAGKSRTARGGRK